MKTAEEWLTEVGEAVMFSAFVGGKPPGNEVENVIRKIQSNALCHAAVICIKKHCNADGEDCAKAILAEADKLDDSPPNNTSSFGNPSLER